MQRAQEGEHRLRLVRNLEISSLDSLQPQMTKVDTFGSNPGGEEGWRPPATYSLGETSECPQCLVAIPAPPAQLL
ncbi:hypothetical protein E5288_WYG006755 [Bos mutus]|uniref:Uncharacterized protein n=1 Tax=Bos mutus TaxID=72004 RepID=A0A6B0RET7_9CETA|nr:hypothetical protein [Bos mutus]